MLQGKSVAVALRKESVDRNALPVQDHGHKRKSLSARRAWIEIRCWPALGQAQPVALRKESVDRNPLPKTQNRRHTSRSPQGERG